MDPAVTVLTKKNLPFPGSTVIKPGRHEASAYASELVTKRMRKLCSRKITSTVGRSDPFVYTKRIIGLCYSAG